MFSNSLQRLLLTGCLVFPYSSLFAQKPPLDYVIKFNDSTRFYGFVTPVKEGVRLQSENKSAGTVYDALEVKEFKYQKRIFISVPEGEGRVFIERVVAGAVTLYKKGSTLTLTDDKGTIDLNQNNFRSELKNRLKCDGSDQDFLRVRYSRASIANVVKRSNEGTCDLNNIQYRKFGAFGGAGPLTSEIRIYKTSGADVPASSTVNSAIFGVNADLPVYSTKGLYFMAELSLTHSELMFYNKLKDPRNVLYSHNIKTKMNTVTLPFGLNYMMPGKSIRPYLKLAGSVSYVKLDSPGYIMISEGTSIKTSYLSPIERPNNFFWGALVGVGTEIPFSGRKGIFLEARYSLTAGGDFGTFTMNNTAVFFLAGFHI